MGFTSLGILFCSEKHQTTKLKMMKTIKSILLVLTIALFSSCDSDQIEDNSTNTLDATSLTERGGCNANVLRNDIRYRIIVRNRSGREETYNIPRNSITRGSGIIDIRIRLRDVFSRSFLAPGVNRIILRSRGDFLFATSFNSQPGATVNRRLELFNTVDTEIRANRRLNAVTRVPGRFSEADISLFYQIECR